MEYRDDDRWLFGPDPEAERGWKFVVALVCIVLAGVILNGCDGEAAQVTAQVEEEAHAKKVALMGMPCTWVAQCSNLLTECPVRDRKCVRAE